LTARRAGRPDAVLDARVRAVAGLELCDVCARLVGDKALKAVAVVVCEGELGARVRSLAATDQPGAVRPLGRERDLL